MKRFIRIAAVVIMAAAGLAVSEQTADAQLSKLLKKNTETASTVSAAQTAGSDTGAAIKALHAQYKADKKLDMTNLSNIANIAKLANGIDSLKKNAKSKSYDKDYAKGLVLGSKNLVNNSNSASVLSSLKSMADVDFSAITGKAATAAATASQKTTSTLQKASEAATQTKEIADSVTSLMKLFK